MQNNILMPGDSAGNYNEKWTKTFDLKFLILWLTLFVLLLGWASIFDPNVNYTRKIQHFAAYLVPLLSPPTAPLGILPHLWKSLFVLFMFLVLIKPIREFSTFFMLQEEDKNIIKNNIRTYIKALLNKAQEEI